MWKKGKTNPLNLAQNAKLQGKTSVYETWNIKWYSIGHSQHFSLWTKSYTYLPYSSTSMPSISLIGSSKARSAREGLLKECPPAVASSFAVPISSIWRRRRDSGKIFLSSHNRKTWIENVEPALRGLHYSRNSRGNSEYLEKVHMCI